MIRGRTETIRMGWVWVRGCAETILLWKRGGVPEHIIRFIDHINSADKFIDDLPSIYRVSLFPDIKSVLATKF